VSPPMGFNSWNFYHCNIDENTVKAVIDAIAEGPLKAAGCSAASCVFAWARRAIRRSCAMHTAHGRRCVEDT